MGPPRQSGVERYQSIGSASLESRRPAGRHGRTPARRARGARAEGPSARRFGTRFAVFFGAEVELVPNIV
jgi:hypothetical protein